MADTFKAVKHLWDAARTARQDWQATERGEQPNNPAEKTPKGCGHGGNPGDVCSDCSFTPSLAPREARCRTRDCDNEPGGPGGFCDNCVADMYPAD